MTRYSGSLRSNLHSTESKTSGLSTKLRNLELRLTPPTRENASLYILSCPKQSTQDTQDQIWFTPTTRDSVSLCNTLHSTESTISGLSTKLRNLELRLTLPTRDSESLCIIFCPTEPTRDTQDSLRLTPPIRDRESLRSTSYSTNTKISRLLIKLLSLELQLISSIRDSVSFCSTIYVIGLNLLRTTTLFLLPNHEDFGGI